MNSRGGLVAALGEAYLLADRLEDAAERAAQALGLCRKQKDRLNEAWTLRLLGENHSHRARPDVGKAEDAYRHAVALAEEIRMRPVMAHSHLGLARLYRQTGRPRDAAEQLFMATALYRAMDMGFWLEEAEALR